MATLKAMFKLFDGYSSTADKVIRKTDEATGKILKASGATDEFNDKLEATGASASIASGGLKKFLGVAALIAAAKKGMDLTDSYTNTAARLNLINDGLQTQYELQDKIFAAANRAKGSYASMADAVAKLQLNAADQFKNNNETIAFTELLQKSFKVGGTSTSEQSSAMLQLTQAMGAGKLQGDEFRSIMENAPMVADAIAKYMGKSKGELKELSSEGAITADIIKAALFSAGEDINAKFEEMPMTFADIWNKIANGVTKAFRPILEGVNNLINSDTFMNIVNGVIVAFGLLSMAVSGFFGLIADNWPLIQSILLAIGIYLAATLIPGFLKAGAVGLMSGLKAAAGWIAMNAPMIMVIASIALLIYALGEAGVTVEDVFSTIGSIIGAAVAIIVNLFLGMAELILGVVQYLINPFVVFGNFIGNLFTDPISAVIYLFQGMADTVLALLQKIASSMDFVFGTHMADSIGEWRKGLKQMADDAVKARGYDPKDFKTDAFDFSLADFDISRLNVADTAAKGGAIGKNIYTGIADKLSGFKNSLTGEDQKGFDMSQFEPIAVEGNGKNKAVKVNMSDEDLGYLQDIAERDYINKFSTATLAPNINVSFGDVHETADTDKVRKNIEKILKEEIAMVAEGV